MGELVRLGSKSAAAAPRTPSPEAARRGLLIGALVALITLALAVIVYVSWPRTPANIVAGPATPDVSNDSEVFDPKVAEEQQRVRTAEQEREDSAVFGQAPSAAAYQVQVR